MLYSGSYNRWWWRRAVRETIPCLITRAGQVLCEGERDEAVSVSCVQDECGNRHPILSLERHLCIVREKVMRRWVTHQIREEDGRWNPTAFSDMDRCPAYKLRDSKWFNICKDDAHVCMFWVHACSCHVKWCVNRQWGTRKSLKLLMCTCVKCHAEEASPRRRVIQISLQTVRIYVCLESNIAWEVKRRWPTYSPRLFPCM